MADFTLTRPGIYAITHLVSGTVYVGSAISLTRRWARHRQQFSHGRHHSPRMQKIWATEGPDAFTFVVLEPVADPQDLLIREQHWIDLLDAACATHGFNSCPAAGSRLGSKWSESTRARMKLVQTGRRMSPDSLKKLLAAGRAWRLANPERPASKMSEKGKAAVRAALTGRVRSPQHRARLSEAKKGQRHSEATRALLSKLRLGRKKTPEHAAKFIAGMKAWQAANPHRKSPTESHRAAISAALKGRVFSAETRARMSTSARTKPPVSADVRIHMSAAQTGRKRSPEQVANMTAAQRARRIMEKGRS